MQAVRVQVSEFKWSRSRPLSLSERARQAWPARWRARLARGLFGRRPHHSYLVIISTTATYLTKPPSILVLLIFVRKMTEKDIEAQGEAVEEAAAAGKKGDSDKKSKVTVMKGASIEDDGMRVAGVHINQLRMPLVGMFVSATVLLISVLSWKQTADPIRWREYAISVPAVTMSFSFLFILMTCKESFYKKNGKYANIVLFIWNFVGACLLTFIDPFTATGNGCELHVAFDELHLHRLQCIHRTSFSYS